MKRVEINLSDVEESLVKTLCMKLSKKFSGCTVYKALGYWDEQGHLWKDSYDSIKEESGYGVVILIGDHPIEVVDEIVREVLTGSTVEWVQVVSYEVETSHICLTETEGSSHP